MFQQQIEKTKIPFSCLQCNTQQQNQKKMDATAKRRIQILTNWVKPNPITTNEPSQYQSFDSNSTVCCENPNVLRKLDSITLDRVQDTYTTYYRQLNNNGNHDRDITDVKKQVVYQLIYRIQQVVKKLIVPVIGVTSIPLIYTLLNRKLRTRIMIMLHIRKQHNFNLIEMLISISILLAFTSLTSAVYIKQVYSSFLQMTKVKLNLVNQALMLHHAETGEHPLTMPQLDVDTKDAWGNDIIYVPYLNLDQKSQQQAHIEKIAEIISVYAHAPEILYLASKGEFCFAEGPKGVVFSEDVSDQNKRYILSIIKKMREGNKLLTLIQNETPSST
jgi:type II secretory pathway pseudopilin PulG